MTGNTLGKIFQVTTWGESHGQSMGCVIDGCPAGIMISEEKIREDLDRDVPFPVLTRRTERNEFQILSGVFKGETIGTPISIVIENGNVQSESYKKNRNIPRPGHADLTYRSKYGHVDWRGGSRASGRTWISVIAAGAIAKQICNILDVGITSKVVELGGNRIDDGSVDGIVREIAERSMITNDSTGGKIEVCIENLPAGLGAPAFNRFQADIGHGILNIPGIRSFEIGSAKEAATMNGSQFNDGFCLGSKGIKTSSNRSGGVLGGITHGAPVYFTAIVKPTPSVSVPQISVDIKKMEETMISSEGRFDTNFTPRTLVIAEAISAIITVDHLILSGHISHDSIVPFEDRLEYDPENGE